MQVNTSSRRFVIFAIAVVAALLLLPSIATAAPIPTNNVLDNVVNTFWTQTAMWGNKMTSYAERIFLGLAVIGLIWNCGFLILERADLGAFFATFIRWMLFTGFFWWLTMHAPAMANDIISSFQIIGSNVGGLSGKIGPSAPLDIGFQVIQAANNASRLFHPIDNLVVVIISIIILIALGVIAANMLITLCTAWVLAYAGALLVGFGAVKWTSDIAINYFRTVLGISITYMTMLLLVGLCLSLMNGFAQQIQTGGETYMSLLVIMIVAVVLAFLVHKIPPLVGSITGNNGGAHGSLGVGTALGAMAVAGAAIATGGASLAAGAAGGAKAIMAAVSAGSAAAGEGASGGGGSLGGGGGGELAGAMGGAANDSDGGAPLAAAMGGGGSGSGTSPRGGSRGPGVLSSAGALGSAGMRVADAAVGGAGWSGGQRAPLGSVAGDSAGSAGAGVPPTDAGGVNASEGAGGDVAAAAGDADSAAAAASAGAVESSAPAGSSGSTGRSGAQRAAVFAAGAFGAMASGMGSQMANRVAAMNDRWQARVDNTMGGRLAQEIRNPGATAQDRRDNKAVAQAQQVQGRQDLRAQGEAARDFLAGGTTAQAPAQAAEAPTFNGDSISGNDETAIDPAAEVAAFRDRGNT